VRLQAAQGTLAPRAHEQLAILVLLLEDPDREIRETADETITRIRSRCWRSFWPARTSRSICASFFGDRGIFPAEIPPIDAEVDVDDPLIEQSA